MKNARPYLEDAASGLGKDLASLVNFCETEAAFDIAQTLNYDAYSFEWPYEHNAKLILPYRAAASLIKSLNSSQNPPYAVKQGDGSFKLEIFEVRGHLVKLLELKILVVLDSTVPPQLQMLFPDLKEVSFEVPQNIHVIQVTNALYAKGDLYNSRTREIVAGAIKGFSRESTRHLSIVPLKFESGE